MQVRTLYLNGTYSFLRFHFISPGDRALFRTLSSIENTLRSSRVQNCACSRDCEFTELLSHLLDV